MIKIKLPT